MKEFLAQLIIICSSIVLIAKFIDFLLGEKGRKWMRDKLFVRTWITLSSISFLEVARLVARKFYSLVKFIFGATTVSLRAIIMSLSISLVLTLLMGEALDPSHNFAKDRVTGIPLIRVLSAMVVAYLWNLFLDFASYAITRILACSISKTRSLFRALSFWFIDILSCFAIVTITFFSIGYIFNLIAPDWDKIIWFGRIPSTLMAGSCALTGTFPTLIHIVFFVAVFCLVILEVARRFLCFLLERFDEENKSPLTIVASASATLGAFVSTLYKLFVQ